MKIIFLDIDGVLNCEHSKSRCQNWIGIDNKRVKLLRKIVDDTGAKIVLISSWKRKWERYDKDSQHKIGNYLDRKLKRERLYIMDKTKDKKEFRGSEITEWLSNRKVESWVVLDDEVFIDYESEGILPYLVQTSFYGQGDNAGLQQVHVDKAIKTLNKNRRYKL